MINFLVNIWVKPKLRNTIILSVLSLLLVICLIYRILTAEPPPIPGSLRVVVCQECKCQNVERIVDIGTTGKRCKKCNGKLSFAWKCEECRFEYPELQIIPKKGSQNSTMEVFKKVVESRRCPNCASTDTHPVAINSKKNDRILANK